MSDNIRVAKWHPVFGKDLMVGLEATFDIKDKFDYDRNLIEDGMICLVPKLQPVLRKVYSSAIVDDVNDIRTIKFVSCFSGKVEYYRLCFWGKGIYKKPFFVLFARFGEDKSFRFNDTSRPYLHLDFFSKRSDTFIPVFVKILDRESGEAVFLIVEGRFEEEGTIELTIRKIAATEAPPTLLVDK